MRIRVGKERVQKLMQLQVVGWSLREDMTRDIVIDALRMAWFKRHPGNPSSTPE